MKISLSLLFVMLMMSACVSSTLPQVLQRIVVFGDSNVDTGNLERMAGNPLPNSWRGRNSNGPVVPDYLAQDLNVEMKNFAVGGATTGKTNVVGNMFSGMKHVASTGVSWQIDEFEKTEQYFKPSDLVIFWAGSNDILQVNRADTATLKERIIQTQSNIAFAMQRLSDLGARRVIVATRTVRSIYGSDDDLNGRDLNRALKETLNTYSSTTGLKVEIFDAYASIEDMITNPVDYGFSQNVDGLCVDSVACATERFEDKLSIADTYINWDFPHKTTRVHRLMADQIIRTLK